MNRRSDKNYLSDLRAMYAPQVANTLALRLLPGSSVSNWLGDLRLLVGVPFTNLVANNRMLPSESIRFFYVDDNWLDVLHDGATSIGLQSSRDAAHQKNLKGALLRGAEVAAQQQRRRRRGKPLAASVTTGQIRTGFVLRSAVVAGWPGLEVRAYADRDGNQAIELLRLERLAPDVMICIISGERGIPVRIDIDEPSEGLQFGVVLRSLSEDGAVVVRAIEPRWPGFTQPTRTGKVIDRDEWVPPVMRKKQGQETRVVDVLATRDTLKSKLVQLEAMTQEEQLESADFALQMVKSPEQQPFLGGQTMPFTREIGSSSEAIEIERIAVANEDAIFQELFRS